MFEKFVGILCILFVGMLIVGSSFGMSVESQEPKQRYFNVVGPYNDQATFESDLNAWMLHVNPECVTDVDFIYTDEYRSESTWTALVERWC